MKMWRVRACTSRRLRAERNVSWLTEPKYHRSMINMSMYVARDPVTCDSTARHKHSVLLSVSFRTRRSASRLAERRGSIRLAVVRSCGAEPEASVAVSLLCQPRKPCRAARPRAQVLPAADRDLDGTLYRYPSHIVWSRCALVLVGLTFMSSPTRSPLGLPYSWSSSPTRRPVRISLPSSSASRLVPACPRMPVAVVRQL